MPPRSRRKSHRFMPASPLTRLIFCCFSMAAVMGRADPPVPGNLLDPQSAVQAWNAIRLSTGNVERLIREKRLDEIAVQISFSSPALRALERFVPSLEARPQVGEEAGRALASVVSLARFAIQKNQAGAEAEFKNLRDQLKNAARHFDPKTVAADVYFCPMHPDFISEKLGDTCPKCGMTLVSRRIPYSFVYMKPGEPTIRMTAEADGPIVAGRRTEVTVRLARPGSAAANTPPLPSWMCGGGVGPVGPKDLMVMHTQPVHLLMETPGLVDYHHEHPQPTSVPGEYKFSFTPSKTAPYRIWADIVPMATGIQEMPFVDLPSGGAPGTITDTAESLVSTVGGLTFTLSSSGPLVADQSTRLGVSIRDGDGKPVTRLEPVMNAFAHLVGFYDDFKTVIHLHPMGGDILNPQLRGGPSLGFKIFPPKPGFVRLYCQVSVDGRMLFAPFSVNVLPQQP